MQTSASAHLYLLINDSLTVNQWYTIRELANECPDWGGNGVYEARALLANIDSADVVYHDSCSGRQQSNLLHKKGSIPTARFDLYPNPNNGGFTLSYQLQKGQIGMFTIYSMLGDKIASYNLDATSTTMHIDQSSLDNGVYLYTISVNNTIVKRDKVAIMK